MNKRNNRPALRIVPARPAPVVTPSQDAPEQVDITALTSLALATTSEAALTTSMDTEQRMTTLAASSAHTITAYQQQTVQPTRAQMRAQATLDRLAQETPPPVVVSAPACRTCHGAGYVRADVPMGHILFGKAVPCKCKRDEIMEKRRQRFMRQNCLTADMGKMRFNTYTQSKQPTAYGLAYAYVYDEDTMPFLCLQGIPGTGKTHLAVAIALELIEQGETVVFWNVPALMDFLRDSFNPALSKGDEGFATRFNDICQAPWLVLDDCGAEQQTPWVADKFYQIVNYRYEQCLPTVFTTNIPTLLGMEDRIRSRLSDRARCTTVPMKKEDYRSSDARGNEETAKKRVTRAAKKDDVA